MLPRRVRALVPLFLLAASVAWTDDYTGPRPPMKDMVYLVHADNLVPTEALEAKQESKKDDSTFSVPGPSSSARTPLAEPIFLIQSDHISAESLELYRFDVKSGHRELTLSGRRRSGPKALHLSVTKVERGLYKVEAAEVLENGEYALTPNGSNQVFCFQVY
jgi:hypothetical protein